VNFYKRHIGDYLKDTAHLSLLEHGVYARLLDVYYTRESGIPDAQAARLIGARTEEERDALRLVLREFFESVTHDNEGHNAVLWIQARCEREIRNASGGHETGSVTHGVTGEHNGHMPRSSKAERQRRYRERRKALFDRLRELGVTMPFDASTVDLEDALLRNNVTSRNPDSVTSRVTPETHNVTATNSQTPDSRLQTPDLNPLGEISDAGGTPHATVRPAELSAAMRRHSIEAQPGDPRIIAAAASGITVETIEAACAEAKSSDPTGRIKPGFVLSIAERWTADAAKPRPAAKRAAQQRTYHDDRADVIAQLTGRKPAHETANDGAIDVDAHDVPRLGT
jgi:uncharacterized protein YdaU (DUF1376 family)